MIWLGIPAHTVDMVTYRSKIYTCDLAVHHSESFDIKFIKLGPLFQKL